jgi:hypothetical protein
MNYPQKSHSLNKSSLFEISDLMPHSWNLQVFSKLSHLTRSIMKQFSYREESRMTKLHLDKLEEIMLGGKSTTISNANEVDCSSRSFNSRGGTGG